MRRILATLLGICALASTAICADNMLDWGPLLSRDVTPDGEQRWRALGPLWEWRAGTNGHYLYAARPFFSRERNPYKRKTDQDICWPVWTGKNWEDDHSTRWRCLLLASWHDFDTTSADARYSFRVLPFYFQSRDQTGKNYYALFPLGGAIRDFLFYDEVRFYLFPLYGRTLINELQGWFFLWPLCARDWNSEIERHRLFPLYGYSKRRDDFEKYFVLWPIWNHARYGYSGASGAGYVLFPLYGRVKLEDQSTWMFLPPFFRFSHGAQQSQIYAPWPFIQLGRGKAEQAHFWPLVGSKTTAGYHYRYLLWPICVRTTQFSNHDSRELAWVLPFVHFVDEQKNQPTPVITSRTRKIWPLYTYHKQNDQTLLRVPMLMPFKDYEPIDRNYAPLWTLYSRATSPETVSHEALWGMFRHQLETNGNRHFSIFPLIQHTSRPATNTKRWSVLMGALGYERTEKDRSIRLLYFIRLPY